MSLGRVIREAWDVYAAHWRHLVPIAFVLYVLLELFVVGLVLLLGWLGLVAAAFVTLAGVFWVQGALVVAVQDVRDGRADLSVRETVSRMRLRVNTLGVAGILAALGIVFGLALCIVPGLLLATWWILIVPVIMLERGGVLDAFGRSRELVAGNGWSVFALIALTFLILLVSAAILGALLSPLPEPAQTYVRDVVSNTLLAPFVAAVFTLAYYRLRGGRVTATEASTPA